MRVDKIDLNGFKSFGDRTTFNLHPGITCIVGPNGCGKSNVVDAFKWVLGEQSAKSLRGGKMEEVIFAGSQNKKPKGMAEVSLNIAGITPSDNGKEINTLVSRRLYRSGDSDYMINRTSCRLKDIKDLFLDTGLEVKSYSILEQDRISAILSAKPEDRRFLIEEVAGVVKYKVRRHEAKLKLENSRNNLQRINDIVAEVRRQINSLDRQVKKAERYKRLMQDLKEIELKVARRDYQILSDALQELNGQYDRVKEEDAALRAEHAQVETDLEKRRIGLVEKEKALESIQQQLQMKEREVAEAERAIAVMKTEIEHLKESIIRLRTQLEENTRKRNDARRRVEEISSQREQQAKELEAMKATMEEKEQALQSIREDINGREGRLEIKRKDSFRISEELGNIRNERGRQQAALENLSVRTERVAREHNDLVSHLEENERARRELEAAMLGQNNELLSLKDERGRLTEEMNEVRSQLESLRAKLATEREEMASSSSRLDSMKELVFAETHEETLREGVEILSAIADIVRAPREYERAIESALGQTISGFVVSSYDEIKRAVSVLKEKSMGRTAFIPGGLGAETPSEPLPEGALGRASDLISTGEDRFSGVIRALLGNVAVVSDLEAALSMRGSRMLLVTLEGEIVEPSGVVVAGKSKGLLALKRQVRELGEELERRRSRVASLEQETQTVQSGLAERQQTLESIAARAVELEKELSLLRHRAERNTEESERTNRKLAMLKIEQDELEREQNSLKEQIAAKDDELKKHEELKAAFERETGELQETIQILKAQFEEKRSESVDLRLKFNSLKDRLSALENESQTTETLIGELNEKEIYINREIEATDERIRKMNAESGTKEEALSSLVVQANGLKQRISEEREIVSEENETLMEKERSMRSLRARIDDVSHRLSELDVKRTEKKLRIENLVENIRNTYDIELGPLALLEVTEEDEAKLPELKQKIEKLGPVSLGSIDEYEELKQRFEFLTNQQEDLQKSIAELEEAIARINATTRKKLREAYDALKTKFSEVFVNLFNGGRAELILTDEKNILETGIDIIAQPPGKKLQNITLLSGGEKTLTALALLFSSFLIKPTPLCILDEADAALDESNTVKFAQMIKGLAGDIQFLVITHNRVTMEVADHIYGVTMEEPGNSKIVSVELAGV